MGNEAVAWGALAAGVSVACGYPGTPSTETLETLAKINPGWVHVEWSVNEKSAAEVAVGAAYTGARALVTMKQVGLNVAADPVMCVNYVGIKGGLVIYVADDPGPISSQTEQDTRHFAQYARIPVFDCSSPEEAFYMVQDAFAYSEKYGGPVILRSTTRVCHSCAPVEIPQISPPKGETAFEKGSQWVIFPRLSYINKQKLVAREPEIGRDFCGYPFNQRIGAGKTGIACGGVSYAYVQEAIEGREHLFQVLKIATPYPFPEDLALSFLKETERVFVFEELDPVIEDELIYLCGKNGIRAQISGKRDHSVAVAGELSAAAIGKILSAHGVCEAPPEPQPGADLPPVPTRPPVLCAGCPHRASFYAVKKACAGQSAIFCGDIGCYTLGNAPPLHMVDTCLCMGAGVTMAQGLFHSKIRDIPFAFIGDSTFFASGINGVVNALTNQAQLILIVLDNGTTAMTGNQSHPGMGKTISGQKVAPVSIEKVLTALGVEHVQTVDPLEHKQAVAAVKTALRQEGVRAIVFRSPCAALLKNTKPLKVDAGRCSGCRLCLRQLGCPALSFGPEDRAVIDASLCNGCGLCRQICPQACIIQEES
ncbi:MAG: indolepyruvate ferredoxin oxidoreductase subunit alpha [Firmicutes bacterium]|nr:indolepyruvate ferredoxin oxidoreductase subunit alpha [Bacillota bacterium]